MTAGFNPFARHAVESQPDHETAEAAAIETEPTKEKSSPPPLNKHTANLTAMKLLHWIQHRWGKPFICLRDLQIYGPVACKDHATALKLAEALEKNGWLKSVPVHRRDRRLWKTPRAIALGL
jgi:hypothetical protein